MVYLNLEEYLLDIIQGVIMNFGEIAISMGTIKEKKFYAKI